MTAEHVPAPLARLADAGAKPAHVAHALRVWLSGRSVAEGASRDRLAMPSAARERLEDVERELERLAYLRERAVDGPETSRLLVELADGRTVESVLLPRGALCVSTQVGCAVGCAFCMTGTEGLVRQVTAAEILAQVVLARRLQPVRRVVFMGMGEPSHNLDAVLAAIRALGIEGDVGHKDLVFSTVGAPEVFERLASGEVKPALALSLHSTFDERRRELLPRAPRHGTDELLDAALAYGRRTGHPLQLQWTLLRDVNDGDDELARLIERLRGERAVVNFIPYNPVAGLPHERTDGDRAHVMTRALHAAGITAKVRDSAGGAVEAACGQLRAKRGYAR